MTLEYMDMYSDCTEYTRSNNDNTDILWNGICMTVVIYTNSKHTCTVYINIMAVSMCVWIPNRQHSNTHTFVICWSQHFITCKQITNLYFEEKTQKDVISFIASSLLLTISQETQINQASCKHTNTRKELTNI